MLLLKMMGLLFVASLVIQWKLGDRDPSREIAKTGFLCFVITAMFHLVFFLAESGM